MTGQSTRIPPPPPPRRPEFGWDRLEEVEQNEQEEEEEEEALLQDHGELEEIQDVIAPPQDYLLTVKYPCPPRQTMSSPYEANTSSTIHRNGRMDAVQIQVYPLLNSDVLAQCVTQAVSQSSVNGRDFPSLLVGLFGEQDRIFHSFEHILSLPDPSWQAYCTVRPSPIVTHDEEEPRSEIVSPLLWVGTAAAVVLVGSLLYGGPETVFYYIELAVFPLQASLFGSFHAVHDVVFNLPFRELYRQGPHLIGWEGLALAEVCNRITHFGGRDFWMRNMSECEEIYAGKEEAFLRTLRPMAYTLLCILSFFVVRHLVAVYGESKRNRTDRAVLEAYHAFQTLVRIANRQNSNNGAAMDHPSRHRR